MGENIFICTLNPSEVALTPNLLFIGSLEPEALTESYTSYKEKKIVKF